MSDANDTSRAGTEQWTVERLIDYAQTMDRAYQRFGNDGLDRRKLAFDARKWARTKRRLQADKERDYNE